ncbi:PREDICTED: uncharacterized protein LOC109580236 isoform X2 [Amphimedon queenslandica]|uniref:EF-hand domain-containing protein n=1 Tax=Amphimedon queenslandica TaxID=400682 RepID=A0AAN0IVB1_AMPQE|nr:PREDICTED: uncharacterized protein LOC109580236 isoform X2 [Amphimedon queenslandica]|eukprot:XP_019848760.1 PREDICTED: uncharacterized protein LOC109580236 isoform X2 [Amphimedon queenslandica]
MADLSKLPWLASGSSRTDIDAISSTTLHSIYGSQVSQLPLSSDDEDWYYKSTSNSSLLCRPKSAPASKLKRTQRVSSARPRPPTATRRISVIGSVGAGDGNPMQRRIARPSTAAAHFANVNGPSNRRIARPSTAQPIRSQSRLRRISSAQGGHLLLNNTSESSHGLSAEAPAAPRIKEISTPVSLSSVPQYFNFWNEKPIRPREWDVTMHQRKSRRRPKSDYGNRFSGLNRKRLSEHDRHNMAGGEGLGTLYEDTTNNNDDDDDNDNFGKGDKGGRKGKGGMTSNENETGDILITDIEDTDNDKERLGGDDTGLGNNYSGGDYDDPNRLKNWKTGYQSGDEDGRDKFRTLDTQNDKDNEADEDDYFLKMKGKKKGKSKWLICDGSAGGPPSSSTRFELPMDLKILEKMTPSEYLSRFCIIHPRHKAHFMKTFNKLNRLPAGINKNKETLVDGIIDVHFNFINRDQVEKILEIADISQEQLIDFQLFGALCVLTERYYKSILTYHYKEIIEIVDFEALDWRLRDCAISKELNELFKQL